MDLNQNHDSLKKRVIKELADMSGYDESDIKPEQELEVDLGLTTYQREALATPFLRIAKEYNSEARITRTQCLKLDTVEDSINLVSKGAGVSN